MVATLWSREAHPVGRLPALVAGMADVLALSGCGSSTDVQSASITPVTGQTQAVATAQPAQSTSKAPAQADREVLDSTFFLSPDGNIACSIDMNMGVRCDIIYAATTSASGGLPKRLRSHDRDQSLDRPRQAC